MKRLGFKWMTWGMPTGQAIKFYDKGGEKSINCVTGKTLFQSNTSVNVLKVEIYI